MRQKINSLEGWGYRLRQQSRKTNMLTPSHHQWTWARHLLGTNKGELHIVDIRQRIWIITRSPRLTFCRPKLLPVYCLPPPTTADHPPPASCFSSHRGERIWSSFGRPTVQRGLLSLIHILWHKVYLGADLGCDFQCYFSQGVSVTGSGPTRFNRF